MPVRLRLTVAFAAGMALVLAGLGMFLYIRLGEELLASIDLGLRSQAQIVQAAVADANAQEGRAFELSLSVGIARFNPDEPVSIDRLIEEADGLMYSHKRAKRGLEPAV